MSKFGELIDVNIPVLLDFFTEWNEQSAGMHAVLRDVAAALGDKAKVIKIDVDKNQDLAEALDSKKVGGAAIDVFPKEPKSNDEPLDSPLRGYANVILTPHVGGSTVEAQANIGTEVAEKFVQFAKKGNTVSAVNFPEIAVQQQPNTHRLLHIHHNQPGVLSNINQLFAKHNINILAQNMMTRGEVGYLLIDVAEFDSQLALEHLNSVEGTIRLRVLY